MVAWDPFNEGGVMNQVSDLEKQRALDTDIRELWESLGLPPLRNGANVKSPWREDKAPSVQVGGAKNVVHDYGTGETYDTIGLYRKEKSCTYPEAVEAIIGTPLSDQPLRCEKKQAPKVGYIPVAGDNSVSEVYTYEGPPNRGTPFSTWFARRGKSSWFCVPHPTEPGKVIWKGPLRKYLYRGRAIKKAIKDRRWVLGR